MTEILAKDDLRTYLHNNIPLSKAMGVDVERLSKECVILSAPFEPNINHKRTVFGGSLSAMTTLSCWSFLYVNLLSLGQFEIVVTHSEISYLKAVQGDFEATCTMCDKRDWERFLQTLLRKKKARITLSAMIGIPDAPSVMFKGTFAAFSLKP